MRTLTGWFLWLWLMGGVYAQTASPIYYPVVPQPRFVYPALGSFNLKGSIRIYVESDNPAFTDNVIYMPAQMLSSFFPKISYPKKTPSRNFILIRQGPVTGTLNPAAYYIQIKPQGIIIQATGEQGVFYALQTLKQIIAGRLAIKSFYLPAGEIIDWPRYNYRGMMLDVARHFYAPDEVMDLIDYLALFKINKLHLHLSDDQGWRLEIKSYPELTNRGALIEVDSTPGGYYTQQQFKDLVAYAHERFIDIIPEIDMPGHSQAALASYDFLNCDGKRKKLYHGTDVGFSSFCTRKDTVYKFIDKVIEEIAAISPSPYIHIGGDESDATPHDEYVRFVEKVQQIVRKHGKIMVGWDEIARSQLDTSTVVQFWIHRKEAIKAARQGNHIIFSYAPNCYLDMKYHERTPLGLHWAGYIPVSKAYRFRTDTIPGLRPDKIIGIEAPLWTETVRSYRDIIYLTFPRICAYAEIGWTSPGNRHWEEFRRRLSFIQSLLPEGYFRSGEIPWDYPKTLEKPPY